MPLRTPPPVTPDQVIPPVVAGDNTFLWKPVSETRQGRAAVILIEGWDAAGVAPRTADWRVAKSIFVADDERTAREYAFGAQSPYRFYYKQLGFKLVRAGRANPTRTDSDQPVEPQEPR
jgi:hypothetical protein